MKSFRSAVLVLCALFACLTQSFAADGSSLKPPKGASVAIHVFEDLECPYCARAYPMIWEAANSHHIPVVIHDFPLPQHAWALQAALWARYFDVVEKRAPNLGNEFRGYIYQNQDKIDPTSLPDWVGKFAKEHKLVLPKEPDPKGKFKALIDADVALGKQVGLQHTPTIFVVSISATKPYIEVQDLSKIGQSVEDMQNALPAPTTTPTPVRRHRAVAQKTASATPTPE